LISNLSDQLDLLRGHCSTIHKHEENIKTKTKVPWFFKTFGIRSRNENDELYKSLQYIYDAEIQHHIVATGMSNIIDLALKDIQEALGGPGGWEPDKVPEAKKLLREYSEEFWRIVSKSNEMQKSINNLVIHLN